MKWMSLILASLCEIAWFYCIGYLNQFSFKELYTGEFLTLPNNLLITLSIAGYAGFGVANMVFFSRAVQRISASVAFAVWTGLALVGITIIDSIYLDVKITLIQIGSIGLILGGIVGLKFYADR